MTPDTHLMHIAARQARRAGLEPLATAWDHADNALAYDIACFLARVCKIDGRTSIGGGEFVDYWRLANRLRQGYLESAATILHDDFGVVDDVAVGMICRGVPGAQALEAAELLEDALG